MTEQDPDTVYEMMRDREADEADGGAWLVLQLSQTINHIAVHASFDQHDLIELLKKTRSYIDDHRP